MENKAKSEENSFKICLRYKGRKKMSDDANLFNKRI